MRSETFRVHRHTGITMETRGLLAEWDENRRKLTVSGAAKVPFSTRAMLAPMLNLPVEAIDMIESTSAAASACEASSMSRISSCPTRRGS